MIQLLSINMALFLKIFWGSVYVIMILSVILVVVSANRNPVKTIAWIMVLIFLPILGLVVYIFFGQDLRRRYIPRKDIKKLKRLKLGSVSSKSVPAIIKPEYLQLVRVFDKEYFPVTIHNEIKIYTTGKEKFDDFIEELKKAENHIHIEYYIFADDEIGRTIRDILIEKAKSGVEVRVIYDDVGSWHTRNRFFKKMMDAGVEVHNFLRVRFPAFTSKINYRNHRKVVVIDGRVAFIGGMNIAQRYINGNKFGKWVDMHLKVTGEAVLNLQSLFLVDWSVHEGAFLNHKKYFPAFEQTGGNVKMQIISGGPTSQWQNILQGFLKAIALAQHYVYIQTPYFLPNETFLMALRMAALSGVDVRVMIPEKTDSPITTAGMRSFVREVLRMGVKIYFYKGGFLHSKMMVIDDYICTVGSTNIDFRSFEHNFEANVFIYDEKTALQFKHIFLNDMQHATRIVSNVWEKRPRSEKFFESFVRLFSPLL